MIRCYFAGSRTSRWLRTTANKSTEPVAKVCQYAGMTVISPVVMQMMGGPKVAGVIHPFDDVEACRVALTGTAYRPGEQP